MSESAPRQAAPRFAVPVDYMTGKELTDAQVGRIDKLMSAANALVTIMHECEGSDPGNPSFQSRRMAIASTQLELAVQMACRAALEVK